jgi:enoyl-CoA hydratase
MDRPLLEDLADGVLTLTLNRPERRNALSPGLVAALVSAVGGAASRQDVHAIVLTGAGSKFCAGGDLGAGGMAAEGILGRHAAGGDFALLMRTLMESPVPVIAAVNGDALGGGLGIVAACHVAVAEPGARFGTPELKVGLFPMMIGPVLARSLGRKVLHEMVLCDRRLVASEAVQAGLLNAVSAPGAVLAEAQALAVTIAGRSRAIVALGLRALSATSDQPLGSALEHMNAQLTLNLMTEDAAEGISAFLMRRAPVWKGR